MRVIDILRTKPGVLYTTSPDTPISKALLNIANHDAGSLIVMKDNRLVGLLSFREIINMLARQLAPQEREAAIDLQTLRVKDVMHPDPVVIDPQMDLHALRGLMVSLRQRFMPVVEKDVVIGVLSFYDVAKAVHESQETENRYLKAYINDQQHDAPRI
ncbi:MAG TPA: hypothetical protein DIS96_09455 [Pusillimonas sp.]|nr:hypothetical protein [Pusillimonas sp.]